MGVRVAPVGAADHDPEEDALTNREGERAGEAGRTGRRGDAVTIEFVDELVGTGEVVDPRVLGATAKDEHMRIVFVGPGVCGSEGETDKIPRVGGGGGGHRSESAGVEDDRRVIDDGDAGDRTRNGIANEHTEPTDVARIPEWTGQRRVQGVGVPGVALNGGEDVRPAVGGVGHLLANNALERSVRVDRDDPATDVHAATVTRKRETAHGTGG